MNNDNKPKVTIIKRNSAPQIKEQEPVKAPVSSQPKVTVIKRVQPTVTVKIKPKEEPKVEEKKEEIKEPVTVAPALGIKKEKPLVSPRPAVQVKPVVKRPIRTGASAPEANKNIIRGERIASTLHNGPVIIKSGNLPPVPGQKTDTPAQPNRPRVAGIVGGRPTRTPGQRSFGSFDRRGQGGFNREDGGRPQFRGQGQGGQRPFGPRPGFNGQQNGQRPFGQRPFAPRPNQGASGEGVDLNQKGTQRKTPANAKKKNEDYRSKRDQEIDFQYQLKKKEESKLAAVPKSIDIMENITVAELAKKLNLKPADIISKLFKMGMMVTINQQIDHETAEIICSEYNCEVHLVSLYDETIIEEEEDREEDLEPRAPIVTIMGHVDHGKTKLLDAIRSTNVVAGEFGGITQHIGAYKVHVPGKVDVVFLDTPGHAAFSMMRARGAQVTDIVVLVVAANDGVMPQTREAIDHAMAAKVPIIVAINKCDLPEANPERVMQQLSEIGLVPEEWGGQTLYCRISALKKEGIDDLLDTILLQAEMLELKANPKCRAVGKVLESRIDQGRGTVATVMVQKGTLHQGDYFIAGIYPGRVRAMFDDKGKKIKEAGPSTPVEIIGLSDIPSAGDPFQVTEDEKQARTIGAKRQELEKLGAGASGNKVTLENLSEKIKEGEIQDFNVIIKGDVQGSVEALQGTLEKLSTSEIRLKVIRAAAGAIIESDITLAAASNALVIGFNVRPTPRAQALAEQEKVEIKKYNVIYDVVDDVKAAMEGMLSPDIKEVDIGKGEVRDTFRVPKVGVVAGVYITEGKVTRNCFVRVIRDSIQINQENIRMSSLKRFKDDAKEVTMGYECGVGLENFQDIQIGDQLEFVLKMEVARKLDIEL